MQPLIDNDSGFALQARMIRALAFVPFAEMVNYYEELLLNIDIEIWHGFLKDYFEPYYIGEPVPFYPGRRGDGVFQRATWNVYDRTLNSMLLSWGGGGLYCFTEFLLS